MKTKSKVKKILNKARRSHHNGRMNGKALFAKANRTAIHVTHDIDHYISKRPYQAMGLTLLTGLCIGFLMHR